MSTTTGTAEEPEVASLRLNEDKQRPIRYRRVILRMFGYLLRYRREVAISIVAMFVYSGTVVALPWIVKVAIDRHIATNSGATSDLAALVGMYLLVAVVQFGSGYVHKRVLVFVGQQMLLTMRVDLFSQLQRLSIAFFDNNKVGKIMSRIQNDVEQIQELIIIFVISVANTLSIVGIVAAMMAMDLPLALITVSVVIALVPILHVWQRLARVPYQRVRQAIAEVNSRIQENISGIRVVQSLNRQEMNARLFDEANHGHMDASLLAVRYWAGLFPTVGLLTAISLVLVVSVGGNMVLQGTLHVGVVVAFALYVERLFNPVQEIANEFGELQKAMVAADRIFELLDIEPGVKDRNDAIELPPTRGEVRFEAVDFHYVPETPVLQGVDLHIAAGETVAFVGPTGAGKTTLISLLLRYYDVVGGRISLDGHDVRDVEQVSLARQMSVVLQEPFLFSDTVKDNIRYNRTNATDGDVVEAAKAVGAHEFITELEHGYDTPLQERGGNLSVGQRQLVSFARALVADPRILILDEATANIDTYTELLIQEALKELLKDRTALVIAHRLSTVRGADRIVVVDDGRIVEQGTHEALIAAGGMYSRLQSYTMDGAVA